MLEKNTEDARLINNKLLKTYEVSATSYHNPQHFRQLLKSFITEILAGRITKKHNIFSTLADAIQTIDMLISKELSLIIQNQYFQKLEGSWRGLKYLADKLDTDKKLKIKLMNVSKNELQKDFAKAVDFDQSQLFKLIYESEFGMPGGEPYGILVGDYEFTHLPEDIHLLQNFSQIGAAAFSPFISAASPEIFGFKSWHNLSKPRQLRKIFSTNEYAKWNNFRQSEDARFVTLTLPKVLARMPYGEQGIKISEFNFNENVQIQTSENPDGKDTFCWMNAAYVFATNIGQAHKKYGFATAIRGAEGGGKVSDLPMFNLKDQTGEAVTLCPTQIAITDRREAELNALGFVPLCHYKNTNYAVFFGAQSCHKPNIYDTADASANAAISSRLPYLLATSRFTHYLKVMAREKIGSFLEIEDCEQWLNQWILKYVNANANTRHELKALYPLAQASVQVQEFKGQPGSYNAIVWLRPWLQLEELTASMRLVAKIPNLKNS